MSKPLLLDTFCKAGGCTRGYQNAGFEVVGVDIEPQPRYVGDDFILGDALEVLARLLRSERVSGLRGVYYSLDDFAAIHASPPCQAYTMAARQWRLADKEYPDLIAEVRELLQQTGKPYVIENVPGAPLVDPIVLNGAMFGMMVHRERLFECSFEVPFFLLPQLPRPVKMGRPAREGEAIQPVGHFSSVDYARKQMGCEWMGRGELSQAVPPSFTEFIGRRLLESL